MPNIDRDNFGLFFDPGSLLMEDLKRYETGRKPSILPTEPLEVGKLGVAGELAVARRRVIGLGMQLAAAEAEVVRLEAQQRLLEQLSAQHRMGILASWDLRQQGALKPVTKTLKPIEIEPKVCKR